MRGPLPSAVTVQIPAKRTIASVKIFRRLNIFWERGRNQVVENKAVMGLKASTAQVRLRGRRNSVHCLVDFILILQAIVQIYSR